MRGLHKMRRKNMYNNTYERPRTPIEKAQREADERVYRFSSIDEALGVLSVMRGR